MEIRVLTRPRLPWLRVGVVSAVLACVAGVGAVGVANVAALPAMATTISPGGAAPIPGWPGGLASYQGRYRLVSSSDAHFAQSGTLTIFGRKVPKVVPLVMSGILSLYALNDTSVLYVTKFAHSGTVLVANVNEGIYTGPQVGALSVLSRHGGALVVRFEPTQGTTVTLHFTQISTNPHP